MPDAFPARAGSDTRVAAALALALAALYAANLDFLPGNDATPNAYLAAQLLEGEGFTFSPSKARMFAGNSVAPVATTRV